jgi:hypothetical protein
MHVHASNSRGEALVRELKWVHGMIRRDLQTVRVLAAAVADGLPGAEAAQSIRSLQISGPLWQLKVNCLQYCRFVHMHHHGESALLFPRLRESNPALGPVVDKLESDHAAVSDLLDDVSAAAMALAADEGPAGEEAVCGEAVREEAVREEAVREEAEARERLSSALADLSAVLLAHLDYEEEQISDTLRTWTGWDFW